MLEIKKLENYHYSKFIDAIELEGWYIEEAYLESLYLEFPNDFFVAFNNKTIVGFISALKYSDEFGFISNFIILKEFRSLGYGKILFEHALLHLKNRQIALECIRKQESFYKKYEFKTYYDSIHYVHTIKTKVQVQTLCSSDSCTSYKDGYKVTIDSSSNEDTLNIFYTLIKDFKVGTKIYIKCSPLDKSLLYVVKKLNMKEFSRMSKMYNKIL